MRILVQLGWSKLAIVLALFSVFSYSWFLFKKFETDILPVISYFEIEHAIFKDGSLYISGSMIKSRDCQFKGVIAYDLAVLPPRVLDITYLDTPHNVVSRVPGAQAWGFWEIIPKSSNLKLVAYHDCATGTVATTLFSGAIMETK